MNKLVGLTLVAIFGLAISAAASSDTNINTEVVERIAPAGQLCMSGEDCAAAPVAAAPTEPRSGEEVYTTKCSTCHATGAAGAPKYGSAEWAPRVAKGIDVLYVNAINGFKGMPAKGMCFDCSDDEINAAVDYMVDGSK